MPAQAAEKPAAEAAAVTLALEGWSCRVEADLPGAAPQLAALFSGFLAPGRPAGEAAISVRRNPRGCPVFRVTAAGRPCGFDDLAAGPDWRRFTVVPAPGRRLVAEARAGTDPVLEVREEDWVLLRPELWPRYLQMAFLWLALRELPVLGVHGAVSAHAGHALVLIGPSGSGKSTLSWALHAAGADYYGDECALFTLPEGCLYVLARELRLRPGGLEALGSPIAEPEWFRTRPDDPKCLVHLPPPARPCPRDRASLLFTDGFGPEPALRPVRPREAVQRLMAHMVYRNPSPLARLEAAAALVDRYPCRLLTLGPPAETAALLLAHAEAGGGAP